MLNINIFPNVHETQLDTYNCCKAKLDEAYRLLKEVQEATENRKTHVALPAAGVNGEPMLVKSNSIGHSMAEASTNAIRSLEYAFGTV